MGRLPNGQGQGFPPPFQALAPSPFPFPGDQSACQMQPPWNAQESQNVPAASSMSEENRELIAAVKQAWPDATKAPPGIVLTSKQLTADLHKAAAAIGKARRNLQELQNTSIRHRRMWTKHLQEALSSWQQQIQSYNAQQADFASKLTKAKADLQVANGWLQELNVKAKDLDVTPLEQDVEVGEIAVPSELQPQHVQEELAKRLEDCMRLAAFKGVEEIEKSPKEKTAERKRARSQDSESQPEKKDADSAMQSNS